MKTCHVCLTECEDDAELCPVCGADLTDQTQDETNSEEPKEIIINNPVLVASVEDVVSAEIFKDILTEAGIPYTSDEPDEGTLKVTFGGSFVADDIYVDDTDLDKASKLYEDFLKSESEFDDDVPEEFEDGTEL